jgi:hypothetical protein
MKFYVFLLIRVYITSKYSDITKNAFLIFATFSLIMRHIHTHNERTPAHVDGINTKIISVFTIYRLTKFHALMSHLKNNRPKFLLAYASFTFTTKSASREVFIFGRLSQHITSTIYSACLLSSPYIRQLPYKAIGSFFEDKTHKIITNWVSTASYRNSFVFLYILIPLFILKLSFYFLL